MKIRCLYAWATRLAVVWALVGAGCQTRSFVFQPDSRQGGIHLNFTVETPSQADMLFVVDNSGSMFSKQQALSSSIGQMLAALAPQETSYRIAMVSTDAYGSVRDCNGRLNPPVASNTMTDPTLGAKGNCARPEVLLQRPNDGALGRLIAAYDPAAFDPNNFSDLPTAVQQALLPLLPTYDGNAVIWPTRPNGLSGPRPVIDHDELVEEACASCACNACSANANNTCYAACIEPVVQSLVQAYFRANLAGLGTSGFGWEEGLLSSLWAVGIDPQEANDSLAVTPAYNLLLPNAPNSYSSVDGNNVLVQGAWYRDDAVLATLYLSDEQDCSMPTSLIALRTDYEVGKPVGSICYQAQPQTAFLDTSRMASLMGSLKGNVNNRIAIGLIGGVDKSEDVPGGSLNANPSDCSLSVEAAGAAAPSTDCSCLATLDSGVGSDPNWCLFTNIVSSPAGPAALPACNALGGSRYVGFTNNFQRRMFESVCRNDQDSNGTLTAFGPAMQDFARLATLSCFELNGVTPYDGNGNDIVVRRTPAGSTAAPLTLPMTSANASTPGWYYDAINNEVCLTGIARLVGDVYDIYIFATSSINYAE